MSALKSARDQLRDAFAPAPGLLLVMSGSHTDKLIRLLDTPAKPFWGSRVKRLATLGKPFVERQAELLRRSDPALLSLSSEDLFPVFEACGERPQLFNDLLAECLGQSDDAFFKPAMWAGDATSFVGKLKDLLMVRNTGRWVDYESVFLALPPLQQALLMRLLVQRERFKPYDAEALAAYEKHTGEKITTARAQKALAELAQTDPPLLWRATRGEYALYERELQDWYDALQNAGHWPPTAACTRKETPQ